MGRWTCHGHGLFISCASSFPLFSIATKFSIGILNVAWYHTYLCPYILAYKWNIRLTRPHSQSKIYEHECHIFFTKLYYWHRALFEEVAKSQPVTPRGSSQFPKPQYAPKHFPPLPTFNIMLINYSMAPTKTLKRTMATFEFPVFQSRWRDNLSRSMLFNENFINHVGTFFTDVHLPQLACVGGTGLLGMKLIWWIGTTSALWPLGGPSTSLYCILNLVSRWSLCQQWLQCVIDFGIC